MSEPANTSGLLAGLRVVDLTELGPGPYFTRCLAELGASVTKIERPPHGDAARILSPGGFNVLNLGKTCRLLDLKSTTGHAEVVDLVRSADAFAEGFRPGAMKRLGLDYETLREINPRLVYVSITGFGQSGPKAQEPGHDITYLAAAGALSIAGGLHGEPSDVSPISLSEFCAGQYALSSTLAALLAVRQTGEGRHLDVAIVDCVAHWGNARLGHWQHEGLMTTKAQREDVFNKPAYGVFRTRDGRHIALSALEEGFFLSLVRALNLSLDQSDYATRAARIRSATKINEAIKCALAQIDLAKALELLDAADVPSSAVVSVGELVRSGHAKSRSLFSEIDGMSFANFPVRVMSRAEPSG